jgi:hypothetical protein
MSVKLRYLAVLCALPSAIFAQDIKFEIDGGDDELTASLRATICKTSAPCRRCNWRPLLAPLRGAAVAD